MQWEYYIYLGDIVYEANLNERNHRWHEILRTLIDKIALT